MIKHPVYYGVDYYPEHWAEDIWPEDIRLMTEAGLNAVRICDFAWSQIEPEDGRYDWGWLERIIELLHASEIAVLLCTPTAGPPMWLVDKMPDVLPQDANRCVRPAGGRRHYCANHPGFRLKSAAIAEAMADSFGAHPAVIGWQIDNEFGQENTGRCYCSICAGQFRHWLQGRYQSLDELNRRWGTGFWSQTYTDWKQIQPPTQPVYPEAPVLQRWLKQNPAHILEYERFCSDSVVSYQQLQNDAIRRHSNLPIAHNTTGLGTNKVNYFDLARNLDRIGFDVYPSGDAEDFSDASAAHSFAREIKADTPFWILETLTSGSHSIWTGGMPTLPAGTARMVAWQAFASGAEGVFHFQWRTFPRGAEQLEMAVIDLDGVPRGKYREVKDTASEIKRLGPLLAETKVRSQVGIIFSYDDLWSFGIKPLGDEKVYLRVLNSLYKAFHRDGVGVEITSYAAEFGRYKALIIPMPILMNEEIAQQLKTYVHDGGTLLATFPAGVKDLDNAGHTFIGLPAFLTDLFGARQIESGAASARLGVKVEGFGTESESQIWNDVLEVNGAEVIGTLRGACHSGEAIITRNAFGQGHAYYLGTWPDEHMLRALAEDVLVTARVEKLPFAVPDGVEAICRIGNDQKYICLINWTLHEQVIEVGGACRELITDKLVTDKLRLSPRGVAIISEA